MAADARAQVAAIAKLAGDISKSSLPPAEKAKVRNALATYAQAMQKDDSTLAELFRLLDVQVAARKALEAKDKALVAAAKATMRQRAGAGAGDAAAAAVNDALKKAPNDASLKAAQKALSSYRVVLDLSAFQVLAGW